MKIWRDGEAFIGDFWGLKGPVKDRHCNRAVQNEKDVAFGNEDLTSLYGEWSASSWLKYRCLTSLRSSLASSRLQRREEP